MPSSPIREEVPLSDAMTGRRLRIALCLDSLAAGGTEFNAVRTAEQLLERGHAVTLLVLRAQGPLLERCQKAGVPVVEFPVPPIRMGGMVRRGPALLRLFRSLAPDIVHTQDRYTNGFLVPWARLTGARVIASRRWWNVQPSLAIGFANRVAFRLAHRIVANSDRVADLVCRVDGVTRTRVVVIPNFLDEWVIPGSGASDGRVREELGVPADVRVVGCVANLRPVKGHDMLLEAMAEVVRSRSDVVLVLVGDGESRSALEQQAKRLGMTGNIIFAGSRTGRYNWHMAFDISVLASRSEGFPNTVVEAMAAGKPVVATDVGGTADAVQNGVNGFLVDPGDVAALARAVGVLLDAPVLARRFGDAAREEALVRFRAEAVIPRLELLYWSLLCPTRVAAGVFT